MAIEMKENTVAYPPAFDHLNENYGSHRRFHFFAHQPTVLQKNKDLVEVQRVRIQNYMRWIFFTTTMFTVSLWFVKNSSLGKYQIIVNESSPIFYTDERFLSVAIDSSFINGSMKHFTDNDWKKLRNLLTPLTPAYLRLGGNPSDIAVFNKTGTPDALIITPSELKKFSSLFIGHDLKLLFSCNAMQRSGNEWDSTNTMELLEFLTSLFAQTQVDLQLGNEPNSFLFKYNYSLSPSQLGLDFLKFRSLLNESKFYQQSLLVGPDVTRPKNFEGPSLPFLDEFLRVGGSSINAATWHQYYVDSRNTSVDDFVSPKIMKRFELQTAAIIEEVRKHSASLPVWLTETASAYGGGAPNLSDRFVSSFLYLDKLGLASRMGISIVMKQSLYQDHYAIIDNNFIPLPNFWIAFFFKKLVGQTVYAVESKDPRVRLYAHSAATSAVCANYHSNKPVLVVYGMNLHNYEVTLQLKTNKILNVCGAYIFRPGNDDLKSSDMFLNGKKLIWSNGNVSETEKFIHYGEPFTDSNIIPPYAIFMFSYSN